VCTSRAGQCVCTSRAGQCVFGRANQCVSVGNVCVCVHD